MIALGSETAIADLIAAATDSPIFSPMIDACVDISLVGLASLRLAVMAFMTASVMGLVSIALAMASVSMALATALVSIALAIESVLMALATALVTALHTCSLAC